jgi:hypothetical protein
MHVREHTCELVEFLHDILKVDSFPWAEFPHSVAIHNSCSSVRGLALAKPSEIMLPPFNKTEALLSKVKGLVLVPLDRPDDCCGFGGTFCVTDEAVSASFASLLDTASFAKRKWHLGHRPDFTTGRLKPFSYLFGSFILWRHVSVSKYTDTVTQKSGTQRFCLGRPRRLPNSGQPLVPICTLGQPMLPIDNLDAKGRSENKGFTVKRWPTDGSSVQVTNCFGEGVQTPRVLHRPTATRLTCLELLLSSWMDLGAKPVLYT